ncbi:hypothetical protein P154DRAFT_450723, partial [Amniculicola lignicola CBS 123094]
ELQATEPFSTLTDYQELEFFLTKRELTPRQMRWAMKVADFNLTRTYHIASRPHKNQHQYGVKLWLVITLHVYPRMEARLRAALGSRATHKSDRFPGRTVPLWLVLVSAPSCAPCRNLVCADYHSETFTTSKCKNITLHETCRSSLPACKHCTLSRMVYHSALTFSRHLCPQCYPTYHHVPPIPRKYEGCSLYIVV